MTQEQLNPLGKTLWTIAYDLRGEESQRKAVIAPLQTNSTTKL